jgi:methionyl aminopeptidase
MVSKKDICWCGSGKKWKHCHYPQLPSSIQNDLTKLYWDKYNIYIKNEKQIEKITAASHVAAKILEILCEKAKEGVTTQDLDNYAMDLHKKFGAIPAPLGYGTPPFPKSICTSLNEEICHGIPNNIPLKEGDLLNIDVTSIVDGYYGDTSRMVAIGKIDEEKQKVKDVSYTCLIKAIEICKPNVWISKIGDVIEDYAAKHGCSVVDQFVGHGVGIEFHEMPNVPHHYNKLHIPMVPGMIFTIEPMINAGVRDSIIDAKNHWTARTKDGKPSSQWEHTILITQNGHKILTVVEK